MWSCNGYFCFVGRLVSSARTEGFTPLLGPRPRVLILGSLPSRLSVLSGEYYGNPQNAFWLIMGELFGAGPDKTYATRADILGKRGVAIWDVLASSIRPGSMDAAIESATAEINDFDSFFARNSEIKLLCFNGQAAEKIFTRGATDEVRTIVANIDCVTLPSTSPAYASMKFLEKLQRWSIVSDALGR